jgi:hypothetical protein
MAILVCAATGAEHDACNRGILASGRAGHEMLLTGVGPTHAARRLEERLARGVLPDLIVSSGFAGALSSTLALATWITGVRVGEWNGVARVPVEGVSLVAGPPGLVRCEVLSSSALLSGGVTIDEGATPVAADMESAALAREAARKDVPFAIVRLISDTPAHPLPQFVSPFAAALSATTMTSRLTSAGRGLREAIADPRGVVRLLRESSVWLRDLEEGWRNLSHWPLA